MRISPSLTTAALLTVGILAAQTQSLLILSKRDTALAIVDPVTSKVLVSIPVGQDPHEVIASTDGKVAYVSNYSWRHMQPFRRSTQSPRGGPVRQVC